jgi:hypothetical protein
MFFNFLLIKLAPETIKSKKKSWFYFSSLFLCTVGSEIKDLVIFHPPDLGSRIRIRDKKVRDSDPRSGIKHPGRNTGLGFGSGIHFPDPG